jgi:hypothetical protein
VIALGKLARGKNCSNGTKGFGEALEKARADKAYKQALLLAGMALRAEYDGASYLRYFQKLEVKTVFVRFRDPPMKRPRRLHGSEAPDSPRHNLSMTIYQAYTECREDENLSGYLVQDRPELVGRTSCVLTFRPNGFDLDAIRCDLLDSTTSYATDNPCRDRIARISTGIASQPEESPA